MAIEIIAEIAQGYEGKPEQAGQLAQAALEANADSVKFQLIIADELCIKEYPYYNLFKSLEMPFAVWEGLVKKVKDAGKNFYADIYGFESFRLAKELNVSGVKISTTDFYNEQLMAEAIQTFPRVFISIGGIEIPDIDDLVRKLKGKNHVTLLYGFQAEPTFVEDNHLLRLRELKNRYPGVSFGFMDHTLGESEEAMVLPVLALGIGIDCLEKHITLDPLLKIEDYISALDPARFQKCVETLRRMEKALGSPELKLTHRETEYKNRAGKVVVAKKNIQAGTTLTADDITLKRISLDGSPDCFRKSSDVLGKTVLKTLFCDAPVTRDMV